MRMMTLVRSLGLVAAVAVTGCKSLDITNPNAPDAERALADPAAIEAVAGGAIRQWVNTYEGNLAVAPLTTQAQTYSASWNNFNMNFYSSLDLDGTRNTRTWQNDPAAAGRTSIEWYWEGYYSALSLATNVLKATRKNGLVINNAADTKRAEAVAFLMQGAALSGIAMNYNKGYIIDENADLANLVYSNRLALRDAALSKLDSAIAVASANSFTTPPSWLNGHGYSSSQIAKVARTMAAYLLVNWPRDNSEMSTVDWTKVRNYTSNGMSAGTPFDFVFEGDGCSAWCPDVLVWFNSLDTGRLHTRVANLMDGSQVNPWPLSGNPQPNSLDRRLGNGTFGDATMIGGFGNVPKNAGAGTDFAYSTQAIFNMSRGSYHQSNIGHIRYDASGTQAPTGIYGGYGTAPLFTATQNDLLWAEAAINLGDLATAAAKINNTRVTRGGLTAALASETAAALRTKLSYENEIEILGLGAASYYHRRRSTAGLITGTPKEMPVPAKELGVFGQPLYTYGGSKTKSALPTSVTAAPEN
jgi:starch-binding outer membrane protein, SusD/RagB family